MNKFFFTKCTPIILLSAAMFGSCADKDVYQGGGNKPLSPTEAFDFSLTKVVQLSIDYDFANDYYVLFQLYDRNPMKEVNGSWIKDEALLPVYAAATDKQGRYSGSITIPSNVTEVWLYSDYLGTVSPARMTVSDNAISYNQNDYIKSLQAQTRAVTPGNNHSYPDDWITMPGVDWDNMGIPTNMDKGTSLPSAEILYSIQKTYKKTSDLGNSAYINDYADATSEIRVTKDTEISLGFISSSASYNNVVGYFTYETGTTPAVEAVQKIIAFPNASPISKSTGGLLCGNTVKLKYWNENGGVFEDKFPKGVTVGFCLMPNGFNQGKISEISYGPVRMCYSYSAMNGDRRQRIIALQDDTKQIVAIGFEDKEDFDYCDATFFLKISETDAIATGPTLPPVAPPASEENTITYIGTLTFEDQWPSEGDYDMNDVVVEYRSTIYRQIVGNKVYKIVDEFTPIHSGGSYTCGFGYQYETDPANVGSIEIAESSGRQETDQSKPTVILFDNLRDALKKTFTVTTKLKDIDESTVRPPYNPFIFANNRSTEIHLVNNKPTDKADQSLFNTKDDISNTPAGIYYISSYEGEVNIMPFGINLPNILDFNIPAESIKIYDTYPGFIDWVKSNGSTNKDWYKK